jgi:hypothetical protein
MFWPGGPVLRDRGGALVSSQHGQPLSLSVDPERSSGVQVRE